MQDFVGRKGNKATVLQIQVLGRVEITVARAPLPPLRGKSGLWLLGILTIRANQSVDRDWLAGILWPESAPEQGRANLRRTLTDLRQALGSAAERLTTPTPQTLSLQLDQREADVLAFQAGALERYGGELLPSCPLEWIETERRVLVEKYLALGEARVSQLPPAAALELLERLRAADPLRESLVRLQLTVLSQQGNRAEAQQLYHHFRRQLLENRLGEPSPQTQAHWQALQEAPSPEPAHKAILPSPLTPLRGRQSEHDSLMRLLGSHRLVTLTGLGGIGKTRLALEVAHAHESALFLELAEWQSASGLAELLDSLLSSYESKPTLLVLDNLEQLVGLEARRVVRDQLQKRPQLTLLVTSRRALGLTGEQLFPLEPLELPQHHGSPERIGEFASVQLLVERTRALRPTFELTQQNATAVQALCQQAEGIPLALELLAAHLRTLTPDALLAQVQRARLPLLTRRDDSETPRHQSLTRIVESSLSLLSESQCAGFRRLGVFRGGWSLEAAQAVCALPDPVATIALLETLEDSSLIRSVDGRYSQLETLREFSLASLSPEEQVGAQSAHATFFLTFAERYTNTAEGLPLLDTEQTNLYTAMEALLAREDTGAALRWARALRLYWYHRVGGRPLLERLLGQLTTPAEQAEVQENLGVLCAQQGAHEAAQHYFAEALEHFRMVGDPLTQAKILSNRAGMAIERGELETARRGLEEALPLWRTLHQPRGLGATLNNLSIVTMRQGDLDTAEELIAEALALREAQNDRYGIATTLINRGSLELRRGASLKAETVYWEALQRFQELGDRRGEASALEGLVETFLDQNRPAEARRYLQELTWLRQEYQLSETALQTQLYARIRQVLGEQPTHQVEQPAQ